MQKRILIVEDSPTVLAMLQSILKKEGYETIPAKSGEEALEKIRTEEVDLAIVDTLLPGIDGFEVCKRLKENKKSNSLKVIIITGNVDAVDAVKAEEAGADDYCAKTSNAAAILKAIKTLISD